MMALSVSVALCTRNGERFIEEQVRSILNQTLIPDELVVSDDASSDRTVVKIESAIADWREHHPESQLKMVLFRNYAPLGITHNFEQAVRAATGDLIALSDQDDVWLPNRLERMVAEFGRRPELLLLHTDAFLIDADGRRVGSLFDALEISARTRAAVHGGEALAELLKRNIVTGATTMFRRAVRDLAIPFPPAWLHDEWLAVAAASTGIMDLLEEPLVEYRQHGTNEIGASRLSITAKVRRLLEPGTERNRRLLLRSESLVERFDALQAPGPLREIAAEKLAHERARNALVPNRARRVVGVMAELRTGRYTRFGRGVPDALRDLVQPLGLN